MHQISLEELAWPTHMIGPSCIGLWLPMFTTKKGRRDLNDPVYLEGLGELLRGALFDRGFGWRFRDQKEMIMIKEARAFKVGVERAIYGPRGFGHRHLVVGDNQPVVFSTRKGTSGQPAAVNAVLQGLAALTLVTNSSLDVIWCNTKMQPADEPSRRLCFARAARQVPASGLGQLGGQELGEWWEEALGSRASVDREVQEREELFARVFAGDRQAFTQLLQAALLWPEKTL